MAQNEIRKVVIDTINSNDKFHNVKGKDGIEYGISKERSPKMSAILDKAKSGDEISGEYFPYNGKHYLSDPKDDKKSGGKTFTPRDKSFDAATSAFAGACAAYSFEKDKVLNPKVQDEIMALAKKGYDFIMSKAAKAGEPTTENK